MSALPGLIILANDEIVNVTNINLQLQITEIICLNEFNERVNRDPNYPLAIHLNSLRVLVTTCDLLCQNDNPLFDVIIFVKQGEANVSKSLFGPPGFKFSLPTQRLTIYNLMYGPPNSCDEFVHPPQPFKLRSNTNVRKFKAFRTFCRRLPCGYGNIGALRCGRSLCKT